MNQIKEFDIRYTRQMDAVYLKSWLENAQALKYFPMEDAAEIEFSLSYWMSLTKYQCSLTATIQHIPCGVATLFLLPYKKIAHHCSFKICVDPNHWNKGIGTNLVKNVLHLAKNYFHLEAVHIEVFGNNPLIFLLEKMGFHEFARQENYVKIDGLYQRRTCFIFNLDQTISSGQSL
jgi:RimJ/RimL family protein N-acetyltransferase